MITGDLQKGYITAHVNLREVLTHLSDSNILTRNVNSVVDYPAGPNGPGWVMLEYRPCTAGVWLSNDERRRVIRELSKQLKL